MCYLFSDVFEMDLGAKAGGLPRGRYELELTVTPTKKTTLIQLAGVSNVKVSSMVSYKTSVKLI